MKMTILIVYIDDIIVISDNLEEIQSLKVHLEKEFEIKDLGTLRYFLGMEVARTNHGIVVHQRKYVLDLLEEIGMIGCKLAVTPIYPNHKLGAKIKGDPIDKGRYQRLVRRLIYLPHTWLNIAYVVGVVNQFMHSLLEYHLEAIKRILSYLKATPSKGLFLKKSDHLLWKLIRMWIGLV